MKKERLIDSQEVEKSFIDNQEVTEEGCYTLIGLF